MPHLLTHARVLAVAEDWEHKADDLSLGSDYDPAEVTTLRECADQLARAVQLTADPATALDRLRAIVDAIDADAATADEIAGTALAREIAAARNFLFVNQGPAWGEGRGGYLAALLAEASRHDQVGGE